MQPQHRLFPLSSVPSNLKTDQKNEGEQKVLQAPGSEKTSFSLN